MRILHTSDWHHDARTLGRPRREEVERAVGQTIQAAVDRKVDVYVFGGDLADPDDGPDALWAVDFLIRTVLELSARGIFVVLLPGNHDVIEDGSGRTLLSPLRSLELIQSSPPVAAQKNWGGVALFDGPYIFRDCMGCNLVFLPFTPTCLSYDPAAVLKKADRHPRTVVISHLSVRGVQPGEETLEMPRGRDVWLPLEHIDPGWTILQGHYHRQQVFESDGRKVRICGSLARLTFGEEGNAPAFQIVDV